MFNQIPHQTSAVCILFLSLVIGSKATAQVIEQINVDPYNDSSVQTTPLDINTPPASKITDTVYIDANPTPPRRPNIEGSLTSSPQSLPNIPPLAEPYSEQSQSGNNDNTIVDPTNTSISVSPFDVTPTENTRVIDANNQKLNSPTEETKTIDVNPASTNNNNVNNPVRQSSTNDNRRTRPTWRRQQSKRRTLKDILIESNSSTTENNSRTMTKTRTNNTPIVSTSISNQQARKVLVKVNNEEEKLLIKSYYPEAFNKKINGDSFLQIGIFSTSENIQQVSQSLAQMGFKAIVMP